MTNENEITKEDATTEDVGKGDKYETTPIIERAREEREKLDAANQKKEELLNREEQIMARRELGGVTNAGEVTQVKEETDEEYAEKFRTGEVSPLNIDNDK